MECLYLFLRANISLHVATSSIEKIMKFLDNLTKLIEDIKYEHQSPIIFIGDFNIDIRNKNNDDTKEINFP